MEERTEEKAYDWLPVHEVLFCRLVLRESGKRDSGCTMARRGLEMSDGWKTTRYGSGRERERVESWQSLGELRWCGLCLDEQHDVLKDE